MDILGKIRKLTQVIFAKNGNNVTVQPTDDAGMAATGDVTFNLPIEDNSTHEITTNDSTQALTEKSIDADANTITNIDDADIKALAGIQATKLADGSVTDAELQFINTVTSNVQDQLDTDAAALVTHISDTTTHGTTGDIVGTTDIQTLSSKVIDADANTITNIEDADIKALAGIQATKLADGSVTDTELQHINTVTSNVQDQLDTGATNLSTHTSDTTTHGTTGDIVGTSDIQALTFKSIDADANTITNIDNADIKTLAAIDATKLADGSVSNTELQHLNSVTSNVQDQLNTDAGNLSTHISDTANPHTVTADQVGLGNVDNTSDFNKPVSLAQQTALNLKADDSSLTSHTGDATIHFTEASIDHTAILNKGTNTHAQIDTHIADSANPHTVTATQVGLGNVDNTSDDTKNAANAVLTFKAIDAASNTIINIGTPELKDDIQFPGEGAIGLPDGTTLERPGAPINGMMRYNTDDESFEGYADGAWGSIGGGGLEIVNVTDADSPIAASIGKQYQVDTTGGAVIINLPLLSSLSASEEPTAFISIVDCGSNAAVNNITVNADAADTIDYQDGTSDPVLVIDVQGQSVGFGRANGTTWCQTSGLQPGVISGVLTNNGDLMSHDGVNEIRIPVGTTGQVLTSDGTNIVWEDTASGSGKNYVLNPNAVSDATTGVANTTLGTWSVDRTTVLAELPEETLGTAFLVSGSGLTAGDTVEWAIAASGIDDADGGRFGRARVAVKDVSGSINGQYSIQVYDVTNSVYVGDEDTITGTGTYYLDVPLVAANDYEFHLKAAVGSTTWSDIGLSSITVEPVSQTVAGVIGKTVTDTIAFTTGSSGTTTQESIHSTVEGTYLYVQVDYQQTAGGTGGAGDLRISMPTGYTIDGARCVINNSSPSIEQDAKMSLGKGHYSSASNLAADNIACSFFAYSSSELGILLENSTGTGIIVSSATLGNTNVSFSGNLKIPVLELANAHTPTATDVQYANARGRWYVPSNYSALANSLILFTAEDTTTYDPAVGISNNGGEFTVLSSGTFNTTVQIANSAGDWSAYTFLRLYVDRGAGYSVERIISRLSSNGSHISGTVSVKLEAGNKLYAQIGAAGSVNGTSDNTYITIERVSDYSARKASLPFSDIADATKQYLLPQMRAGTWSPAYVADINMTGTPIFNSPTYRVIGDKVFVEIHTISGMTTTSLNTSTYLILTTTGLPGIVNSTQFSGSVVCYLSTGNRYITAGIQGSSGGNTDMVIVFDSANSGGGTGLTSMNGVSFSYTMA